VKLPPAISSYQFRLILAWLLALSMTSAASADIFVIGADTTDTNGGLTVDGSDTLTINTGVTVDHTGQPTLSAINTTGGNNAIVNNGTIIGDGSLDGRAIVTNGANSTLTNNGVIRTFTTSQTGSTAVEFVGNGATVTNSGTISTAGDNANGILLGGSTAFVTNTGTIWVTGANASAVQFDSSTTGYTTNGITISEQGDAIQFNAGENSLNLNAPAFIEGGISLANSTFVTINTGQSQSFQWTFTGVPWFSMTINGTVPTVISGTTVASIDPTIFEAAPTGMTQTSAQIFGLTSGRTQSILPDSTTGIAASTKIGPPLADPVVVGPARANRWVAGYGGLASHSASGVNLGYFTGQAGVVAGIDWTGQPDRAFGIAAGGGFNAFSANAPFMRSYRSQTTSGVLALYGAKRLQKSVFEYGLMGAIQSNNSQRSINNNALPGGIDTGRASFGSYYIAPRLALRRSYSIGTSLTLTTTGALGYVAGRVNGFTETATASTATFNDRNFGLGTASVNIKLTKELSDTRISGALGMTAQSGFGAENLGGTLLGQAWTYTTPTGGPFTGQIAVALDHNFGTNIVGNLTADANVGSSGLANVKGSASLRIDF
jgi:autotransporter-like protein